LESDLVVELRLEAGVFFPARDGVGVYVQDVSDVFDAMSGEEEAGGGELVGVEGFIRLRARWV
jgi:hypothetical protein